MNRKNRASKWLRASYCLSCKKIRLLIALVVILHSTAIAQTADSAMITLELTNHSFVDALKSVSQQSGYKLMYDEELVNTSKPVTIHANKMSLKSVLDVLFLKQPFAYQIVEKTIVVKPKENNNIGSNKNVEPIAVKGYVFADSGLQPLQAASIEAVGANISSTTDDKGYFSIALPVEVSELRVSYIGFEPKYVSLASSKISRVIEVYLSAAFGTVQDVSVVSTGFQQLPKERSTGSFTLLGNKRFNEVVTPNILDRLPYMANGITAFSQRLGQGDEGLMVRGLSSLAVREPLIILDNFPYNGDLKNINPNDVESFTILKDAAAASIWGARAGNGVVVITTKKGRFSQATQVDLNTNVTLSTKPDLFAIKSISPSDYVDVEQFLFNNGYRVSDTLEPTSYISPVYQTLFQRQNGLITSEEANQILVGFRNHDLRSDFSRYFYRPAVNQQYNLQAKGGSENLAWILSAGLDKNIGSLHELNERFTLRFDNTYKVNTKLDINTNIYFTQTNLKSGRPSYGSINTSSGTLPAYTSFTDASGNPLALYTNYQKSFIDTAGGELLMDWRYFPLTDYQYTTTKTNQQNLNASVGLNYRLLNNLRWSVRYRYEQQQQEIDYLQEVESFATRDIINRFSQINYVSGAVTYPVPKGDILDRSRTELTGHEIRTQLDYNKNWKSHAISAIIGAQGSAVVTESDRFRTYGYNGDLLAFQPVDLVNQYNLNGLGYSSRIPGNNSFSKTNRRLLSGYFNAAYTYSGKYTLSASARKDASNTFGLKTNDKWKPLWSTGLAWLLSQEKFYHLQWMPHLRLKASFGYSGNVDPSRTAVTTLLYGSINPYTQSPISQVDNFANPDLRWEQVGMYNVGLEARSRNNRLSASVEFFIKKVKDMYGAELIDVTTGLGRSQLTRNAGSMKTHGWDIELNSVNIKGRFQWTSDLILNTWTGKITRQDIPLQTSAIVNSGASVKGYAPYSYFVYKWAGLDPETGDPRGYLNGHPSTDYPALTGDESGINDLVYLGSKIPTLSGSLGNSFSWRGLTLAARLVYKFGYYFNRESVHYGLLYTPTLTHSDVALRWQSPGDELTTSVPSMVYPLVTGRDDFYRGSEVLATKGDHIRLQYVNISYDVINRRSKKGVRHLQLYGGINNIGIIWRANSLGLDPDFSEMNAPPSVSYSLGLRAGF